MRRTTAALLACLLAVSVWVAWPFIHTPPRPPHVPDLQPGDPAPDFELPILADSAYPQGREGPPYPTYRLSARSESIVLLDFWADWCAPCIAKFPALQSIRRKYADRGFEVYGVLHVFPTWRALKWFRTHGGAPFPQLQDELGIVADQYGQEGLPYMILVGPEDEVVWACQGCGDVEERLPRSLDSILETMANESAMEAR